MWLLLSISLGYVGFTVVMLAGWLRGIAGSAKKKSATKTAATVLIPFRDEELRLLPLIHSLKNITRELPHWEFIFLDDHSGDDSVEMLEYELWEHNNIKILGIPPHLSGKKAALTFGVARSIHPYIITTDADCRLQTEALLHMLQQLEQEETQMVCGAVLQESGQGFMGRLADLDFLSLMGSGISFWGLGMPFMANGAFLGFKKQAFETVDGFAGNEQYPGGDDVFLLQKISKRFGTKSIRFLSAENETITTAGDRSLKEFVGRRIRWGAKAKAYQGVGAKAATWAVFLLGTAYVFGWVWFTVQGQWHFLLYGLGAKMVCDLLLLTAMIARFNRWPLFAFILPASVLHPFHILITGVLALWGKYTWKERNYRRA